MTEVSLSEPAMRQAREYVRRRNDAERVFRAADRDLELFVRAVGVALEIPEHWGFDRKRLCFFDTDAGTETA